MSASIDELLKGFPVVIDLPVQWGEMDAYGHVNNAVYFRYFETARMHYFERLDYQGLMDEQGFGPILAHTECRFRLPLNDGDTIAVGAAVSEVGEDRFIMSYRVVSRRHAKLAAEGRATIVSFDYRRRRKAPLPDIIRGRIAALQS